MSIWYCIVITNEYSPIQWSMHIGMTLLPINASMVNIQGGSVSENVKEPYPPVIVFTVQVSQKRFENLWHASSLPLMPPPSRGSFVPV